MNKIHQGYQDIERCRMRVRHSVWWPGVSQSISQKVLQCPSCAKEAKHRKKNHLSQLCYQKIHGRSWEQTCLNWIEDAMF